MMKILNTTFMKFNISSFFFPTFCSSSIALSEQENILSDVLSKKQSIAINKVAIIEQREEKQEETQPKLIENSKILKQESKTEINKSTVKKSDREVKKTSAQRKSISKNMVFLIYAIFLSYILLNNYLFN